MVSMMAWVRKNNATDFHTAYIGQIVDAYVVEWQLQKDEQSAEI